MKFLYKPFGIIAGLIGARLGRNVFRSVWARIDSGAPPGPTTPDASVQKVVGAAALQAATMAGVGAAVDRASIRAFHYLTGIWPAKKPAKPTEDGPSERPPGARPAPPA
jgi:hypothetical protein